MAEQKNEFHSISLGKVGPDVELPTDIYLYINQHYVKFKNQGDVIDVDKYNLFLSKNVGEIYIADTDKKSFEGWLDRLCKELIDELTEEVGEENRDLVEKREEIKEKVYEVFADMEIDSGTVELLQSHVSEFIETVKKKNISNEILAKLSRHNQSIADHSVNVANIAVFLAMCIGHGHQYVLENVYMGALFHDYGKAKIPANILENPSGNLYSQAIQDHPLKGAKMLRQVKGVQEQILTIVAQHHEQYNGQGFPKGLSRDDIYELAQIVSIANTFDNTCSENSKRDKKTMYRTAIKSIEYDKGKKFNPALMERVLDGLNLAYGGYYREKSS